MGVYIPKMTMPQNCSFCPCARMNISRNGIKCSAVDFYAENLMPQKGRMKCCPLVEVKPHGRLIDADAFIEDIRGEILEHQMNGMKGTPFYIEDLRTMWQRLEDEDLVPTIIPADKDNNVLGKEREET